MVGAGAVGGDFVGVFDSQKLKSSNHCFNFKSLGLDCRLNLSLLANIASWVLESMGDRFCFIRRPPPKPCLINFS